MQKVNTNRYIYKSNYMITELTKEKKDKLIKNINAIIQAKKQTNVQKLAMVNQLVIRVTDEQHLAYKNLATEIKKPISKIVRNNLDKLVKENLTLKKQTPQELKDNFIKFQRKLGLIK